MKQMNTKDYICVNYKHKLRYKEFSRDGVCERWELVITYLFLHLIKTTFYKLICQQLPGKLQLSYLQITKTLLQLI